MVGPVFFTELFWKPLAARIGWPATLAVRRFLLVIVLQLATMAVASIAGDPTLAVSAEGGLLLATLAAVQKWAKEKSELK